jgi:Icc-related predicted phosphoesterase
MKLLHVTDFHANRLWFKWVADNAEKYDLIAYTGDFLDIFGDESLGSQVSWISAWARALPRPLLWCSGNHDVETMRAPVASGRWLAALPYANAFSQSGHIERLGQAFVRVNWREATPRLRAGDIVLAHVPPSGCFTATSGEIDNGDIDLADALRSAVGQPLAVLGGHVHRPTRWADRCGHTFSLNPGMNSGTKIPNYIEVNTANRSARWFCNDEWADSVALAVATIT